MYMHFTQKYAHLAQVREVPALCTCGVCSCGVGVRFSSEVRCLHLSNVTRYQDSIVSIRLR